MKRIHTLLLIAGIVCLGSCNNDSNSNPNLLVSPAQDSVSKGSYLQMTFANYPGDTERFVVNDLILNNQVVTSMSATTFIVLPDSFFTAKILITDHRAQTMSLSLNLFDSTKSDTGYYYRINNPSTFSDFSRGANKNYSIDSGSYIHVTHNGNDCMTGTLLLYLYYDHMVLPASGSFKIFH